MEKEKFLDLCYMFRNELEETNKWLEEDYNLFNMNNGTLIDLGCNVSYELAIIGLELGYASWQFLIKGNFNQVKRNFLNMIIENERILGCYTDNELKEIEKRIKSCKKNK